MRKWGTEGLSAKPWVTQLIVTGQGESLVQWIRWEAGLQTRVLEPRARAVLTMKCSSDSLLSRSESTGFLDKESGAEAGSVLQHLG